MSYIARTLARLLLLSRRRRRLSTSSVASSAPPNSRSRALPAPLARTPRRSTTAGTPRSPPRRARQPPRTSARTARRGIRLRLGPDRLPPRPSRPTRGGRTQRSRNSTKSLQAARQRRRRRQIARAFANARRLPRGDAPQRLRGLLQLSTLEVRERGASTAASGRFAKRDSNAAIAPTAAEDSSEAERVGGARRAIFASPPRRTGTHESAHNVGFAALTPPCSRRRRFRRAVRFRSARFAASLVPVGALRSSARVSPERRRA